ncbi:translation initiation factor IF-2-like [Panthera tigris]|uniref:translation initiation factor IF-2-like n=1 Tax=Panthera tigris TaxID=9694 RepID=UPI001C6FA536|nr:translation initiation factor IF-2-like [Panthera tigris]
MLQGLEEQKLEFRDVQSNSMDFLTAGNAAELSQNPKCGLLSSSHISPNYPFPCNEETDAQPQTSKPKGGWGRAGGGSRPFPRAARPAARSPRGGARAGAGRRRGSQGQRAGLGARGLPRRAGRWRVGQWLLRPGSCCSRSGGCGGPAGAALELRADALPLSAAAGAVAAAPATARPGAAPELSNSGGRGAEAPGRGPGAERLRALPRPVKAKQDNPRTKIRSVLQAKWIHCTERNFRGHLIIP